MKEIKMPQMLIDLFEIAWQAKDVDIIIELNRVWRITLQEEYNIDLKG